MADTPSTPSTPAAPATPAPAAAAPSTPAQPVHSSDRALANFNSGDPARGGAAPPVDPAKPVAAAPEGDPAAPAIDLGNIDLAAVLGEDLTAVDPAKPAVDPAAAAAPAIDPNADPLEAIKDTPRVKELLTAETSLKGLVEGKTKFLKEGKSEYIRTHDDVEAAIADAHTLWQISEGKADVAVILDGQKQTNPAQFQKTLESLKSYLEKEGIQVAAPAAVDPANMTEDQKRLAAVEKELSDRKASDAKAEETRKITDFNTRIANTKKIIIDTKLPELLKDSIFEGETEHFFDLTGRQLGPKTKELIEAVEKGDFKMLETAVKVARSKEAVQFKARIDRAIALQKKKLATIPRQPGAGSPPAGSDPAQPSAAMGTEARRKAMAASLKTGGVAS